MTPCTDRKHQAMKDDGYAKCWDCGESFYAERKPPVVASDVLLADLMAREEMFRRTRETHERAMVWSLKSDSQMRLDCGELTAHEIRAIRAVLKSIIQNPQVSRDGGREIK